MRHVVFVCLFLSGTVSGRAAPAVKDKVFLADKQAIVALVVERVRAVPTDYQRAVKAGEGGLRDLHDHYRLAKSTPPTSFERDVQGLLAAAQKTRQRRAQGGPMDPDPQVFPAIEKGWAVYQDAYAQLQQDMKTQRAAGHPDSQLYWDITKRFKDLEKDTLQNMVYNAPPGPVSLEDLLKKDSWALLKSLEGPVTPKMAGLRVVAPGEFPQDRPVDIAAFYQSQGLLPDIPPLETGAYDVPTGCRTVTQRESGRKLILRVSQGKALVHVGPAETVLAYGYLPVPPDMPYYIENMGEEALHLEYMALPASS